MLKIGQFYHSDDLKWVIVTKKSTTPMGNPIWYAFGVKNYTEEMSPADIVNDYDIFDSGSTEQQAIDNLLKFQNR